MLWECLAYTSCREGYRAKFKELIGDSYEQLNDIDKTAYVLGSELWEENFEDMLRLVKEFITDVWEVRRSRNSMARMLALVIISVRPWLVVQGVSLGVGGSGASMMGKLQDKSKLGKLGMLQWWYACW